MKKSLIVKSIIALAGVAVITTGVLVYHSKTANASKTQSTVKYMSAKAQKGTISQNIEATGTTTPSESNDVVSFNNGIISNITTKEGDTVKKGQVLGTINDTAAQQAVNLAQLKVQTDNTNIANNKDASKADSLNLQLQQDQSDLNAKTQILSEATITSPVDGVIVTQNFKNGDTVQSGKTIVTIVNMQSLEIDAPVDELDIANVKEGQKATITFDALTGKSYAGTVTKIAQLGKTTNNVTDYDVYVSIDNPDGVKIGMTGNVKIGIQTKDNVITVPLDAIKTINGKKYVMTQEPQNQSSENTNSSSKSYQNGKANSSRRNSNSTATETAGTSTVDSKGSSLDGMTEVTVGIENQTEAEIVSGLNEGDTVYIAIPTVTNSTTNQRPSGGMSGYGGSSGFSGASKTTGTSGSSK